MGSDAPAEPTARRSLEGVALLRRRAERLEKRKRGGAALPSDFIPDDLQDSTYLRGKRAGKMFGHGAGLACRLLSATDHRLKLVTVQLGKSTPAALYDPAVNKNARTVSHAVFGKWPVWAKLERGPECGLHLHLLGAADALLLLPPHSSVKDVEPTDADYRRLLGYLSKPGDARACMVKLGPQRYGKPDPLLLAAAVIDYRTARADHRLPSLSWTYNVPRLKPDMALVRPA
ncbi:hypothetical protein FNU79_18590 [Deinococcus detaillensis]|uniref:Uncharacterized protein n=1 Tax=Deinococcus detaillensis TaxID=2592048 RepID=A0A553UFE7_9DEIO|nr:hypothetical protein [Deinococcus detaillensis]TSA78945.1 hypothetical protein FNU79_18590 [Deinococcus detaillensis]